MTTVREIQLFLPETSYFNETILNLFSKDDYTQMTLSEEFNDINKIEELIQNSQDIINMNEEIEVILQRAKLAALGSLQFDEKREFTTNQNADRNIIRQRGNIASHARNTLKMASAGTNRQSMGIYGLPGEKITIFVKSDDSDPLPSIRFTQYIGHYSNWLGTEFTLVQGRQSYTFDNFTVSSYSITAKAGGPLYISNPYTSDEQSQNIKVYVEGGTLFPTFRLGESEDEYKAFLAEYITVYNNNPDDYLDITELFGYRIMITVQATLAYNVYKDKSKGPLNNLNSWDEYIKKLFIYDGIEYDPSEPHYDIKNTYVNLHIRYAQPFGAAYAAYEHIGIFSDGWFNTAIYAESFGWGFAHEIGHTMDINERTVSENSNNMISKYDESYLRREGTRGDFALSLQSLTLNDVDVYDRGCTSDTCKGFFMNKQLNFLVWWYIESFFPGYWGKLDNMYRYDYSLSTGMSRTERLIFFSNIITGIDLGYYFNRWGFYLNNEGIFDPENASDTYKSAMEEYITNGLIDNTLKPKFWYLDYKEYLYNVEGGEGCYEDQNAYDVQIKNVFYINTTRTILLLPEINCEGHLGFEIYEHNKLIGFTYDYSFIDTNTYSSDYIHEYKIIAIDRKLLQSKASDVQYRQIDAQVCSFNSVIYNSIKDAVEYAESLDTTDELNIYLLKNTYESTISINKAINIYLADDVENIKIFRIDDGPLFSIKQSGTLTLEGKSEDNRIILDGLSMSHKGSLLLSYKGTFSGNYLTFQNNINSENYGGAIWSQSSTLSLSNSLIY
ncbi:MAG: M60 family metallopeptidase, partial [Acholeplasmatales bacterium]|nr:M60 family metallopeptidase [Acholeplasmatales bacterium]